MSRREEREMSDQNDWEIPTGLSAAGRKAAFAIRNFAKEKSLFYTGGVRVFYTPEEWRSRGEAYGTSSELVVVYESADIRYAASLKGADEHGSYKLNDALCHRLQQIDVYLEEGTTWFGSIYKA